MNENTSVHKLAALFESNNTTNTTNTVNRNSTHAKSFSSPVKLNPPPKPPKPAFISSTTVQNNTNTADAILNNNNNNNTIDSGSFPNGSLKKSPPPPPSRPSTQYRLRHSFSSAPSDYSTTFNDSLATPHSAAVSNYTASTTSQSYSQASTLPFHSDAPNRTTDASNLTTYQDTSTLRTSLSATTNDLSVPDVSDNTSDISFDDDPHTKRWKIMNEILQTEILYLNDLKLINQIYIVRGRELGLLSQKDIKLIFVNLDDIILFATDLIDLLTDAVPQDWIGNAFAQSMKRIESVYCEYCKFNESGLIRVAEFSQPSTKPELKQFLQDCRVEMNGKTNAWDLSSLLVKPVQRVLKYPLLLRRLLEHTPPDHSDYAELKDATESITNVAVKINQVKKQKDIVEHYVKGKPINVIHGITKKINRGAQLLKNVTGINETETDQLYEGLETRFETYHDHIQSLDKLLVNWTLSVRDHLQIQLHLVEAYAELYTQSNTAKKLREYRSALTTLLSGPIKTTQTEFRKRVSPLLVTLLGMFRGPLVVIKKRASKLLDHERVKALDAKKAEVEKPLRESAEAYVSIHAELCQELPLFLALVSQYMHAVTEVVVDIQMRLVCAIIDAIGGQPVAFDEIRRAFVESMRIGGDYAGRIDLIRKWTDPLWVDGVYQSELLDGTHVNTNTEVLSESINEVVSTVQEAIVIYDFEPELEHELRVGVDERVRVYVGELLDGSDEWVLCETALGMGWVPATYIQFC
ncbi:hypothetical protein BC833DRAFT_660055 [Globomyces pollinis-pini]|nr:hypothetical protein BC833DRAFT_660055 [Globomyces pollinis-pini]